jgi:hypothetical protein
MMDLIVGIDLGTTNSLVAVLGDDGPAATVSLPWQWRFSGDEVRVGGRGTERPFDTILSVKRFHGARARARERRYRRRYPWRAPGRRGFAGGRGHPPELGVRAARAQAMVGGGAAAPGPGRRSRYDYFHASQPGHGMQDVWRGSGAPAGERAAASLAYGEQALSAIAVYDLGGGATSPS